MWSHITKGKLIHTPLSSNSVQNSDAKSLKVKEFLVVVVFLSNISSVMRF